VFGPGERQDLRVGRLKIYSMSVVFSLRLKKSRIPADAASAEQDSIFMKGSSGALVILIHGMTGSPNEMKSLAASLNRKGYSVVCPRLANHGEPLDVLKKSKWRDFYESVRRIMTDGEASEASGPVFVSGLSMGALLALLLADEFKERVAGVSCLAPTLFYDGWNSQESKFWLPLGYKTFLKHFFYFKEEPPYGTKNEIIRERIHKYYSEARLEDTETAAQYGYPYFPVTLLHQMHLLVGHLTKRLPHIQTPVQLIQAKDDDTASLRNSKYIYDNIGSGVKEMILLYDSYHVITADQERDTVARKVEGFFSRLGAGVVNG
jgi:carboxylesterase